MILTLIILLNLSKYTPSIPDYWAIMYIKTNFIINLVQEIEIFDIKIILLESSFEYESNSIIIISYIIYFLDQKERSKFISNA
jgi:hypothetical protein